MPPMTTVRTLWTPERALAPLAHPVTPEKAFGAEQSRGYAPALHETLGDLSLLLRGPADLYGMQRDRAHLSESRTNADRFAPEARPRGLAHISVAHDGTVSRHGNVTLVGSPRTSLAPEWITEFPTVVYRLWYALQVGDFSVYTLPGWGNFTFGAELLNYVHEKHPDAFTPGNPLVIGHSKGGHLAFLLGCLRKSHKEGRLDDLIRNLTDASGKPILAGIPREALVQVAEALERALIGSIGSPHHGIGEDFAKAADLPIFAGRSFNDLTGNSARYFERGYLERLYDKIGYRPNQVLDFVVTSKLKPVNPWAPFETMRRGAAALKRLASAPIVNGGNVLFNGFSRFLSWGSEHDGVASYDYPEVFPHHLKITGATHLDQVERIWFITRVVDFLNAEGLLQSP